jgi:curved DNA-binding protein
LEFRDYYKALGVEPEVDEKAITQSYRRLARKYHPDVSKQDDAEEKFKEIAEAYAVLKDKEKRAEYDELRKYGASGREYQPPPDWQQRHAGRSYEFSPEDEGFSDFFDAIFGEAARRGQQRGAGTGYAAKGQDVEVEMPIFLEDTLSKSTRPISLSIPQYSPEGRRLPDLEKTLNVKIPRGVSDGERVRLKAQGAPGIGGGQPGDLYLHIRYVPHPLFDVQDHDLIVTVPLAPWEAALGKKISVPTLEGDISLTIPANSQSGQRLRARGKGLPKREGAGDLYALLNVVMPVSSNDSMKKYWQELEKAAAFDARRDWRKK